MKLLIDADFIVYKCCAAAEDEIDWGDDVIVVVSKFSEALQSVERELSKIKEHFMWDTPEVILFFSDSENFRKKFTQITRVIETERSLVAIGVLSQSLATATKLLGCLS